MNLSVVGAIVVLVLVAASALWYYQSRAIAEQRLLTRLVRDLSDADIEAIKNTPSQFYDLLWTCNRYKVTIKADAGVTSLPQLMQDLHAWVTTHRYLPTPVSAGGCNFPVSDLDNVAVLVGALLTKHHYTHASV
jgi:uncharacterized membrane protein